MRYKDNWEGTQERWAALWEGRFMGRPCMTVEAPNGKKRMVAPPRDGMQSFFDPDYVVQQTLDRFNSTWFGAEAFPSAFLNGGWLSTVYEAQVRLDPETIWIEPYPPIDWDHPPSFELNFENDWFLTYKKVHDRMLEAAGKNHFMIGEPAILPGHDLLSMLMGTTDFLMALLDHPQWMRFTIDTLAKNYLVMKQYLRDLSAESNNYWYGAGWTNFWGPQPYLNMQSDVSCMVSPEMFDEFIMPELDMAGKACRRIWYHLDGPDALKHVPCLCSRDYIKVIQWVPGAGEQPQGPAWIDLYRQIQAAGKIVDLKDVPAENVQAIVEACDPSLLCLHVVVKSVNQGKELIDDTTRWCISRTTFA